MDPATPEHLRLRDGADFQPLFEDFVKDIRSDLIVSKGVIADFDSSVNVVHLPKIAWEGSVQILSHI